MTDNFAETTESSEFARFEQWCEEQQVFTEAGRNLAWEAWKAGSSRQIAASEQQLSSGVIFAIIKIKKQLDALVSDQRRVVLAAIYLDYRKLMDMASE